MGEKSIEKHEVDTKKPFMVIKFVSKSLGYQNVEYERVSSVDRVSVAITKEKAMELIEEYEMEKVYSDRDGMIWEAHDKPFYAKNKGHFAKKEEAEKRRKEMLAMASQNVTPHINKVSEIKKNIKHK